MLINLHSHLEGRVRPSTATELASQLGLSTPAGGWEDAIRLQKPGTLTEYLVKVAATYPFFQDPEAVFRIAREAVEDAANGGLDYLEVRFGPATHAQTRQGLDDIVRAVVDGLRDGAESTGISVGAVVAALRHHDEATNISVARSAESFAGNGVVGFDLAGDERLFPHLEPHRKPFAIARSAGLGITCHAAEAGPATAAREAVTLLGATRIGHGAHIVDDPEVLSWAAGEGIVVEVCPTSNWFTGAISSLDEHPAPRFREAGILLVVGDDNPRQTGTELAHERDLLRSRFGWTPADDSTLDQTSITAAFLDAPTRARLTAAHEQEVRCLPIA